MAPLSFSLLDNLHKRGYTRRERMNRVPKFLLRFLAFLRRDQVDAQMDEELRSHIEMQTEENIRAGMSPQEARYTALREFGRVESIKERCREQRSLPWAENILRDVRYGTRVLRKNPAFTLVAVLTLALGIGATTIVFSIIDGVLLQPLEYPDSGRIVNVWEGDPKKG